MVKVAFKAGQLLDVHLLSVHLKIPPVDITLFDIDWITNAISGLFIGAEQMAEWGDVNKDGIIDGQDEDLIRESYGYKEGEDGYNPNADLNKDGIVDLKDLSMAKFRYGTRGGKGFLTNLIAAAVGRTIQFPIDTIPQLLLEGATNLFDDMVQDFYERHEELQD